MNNTEILNEKIQVRKNFETDTSVVMEISRDEFLKMNPEDQRKYLDQQSYEYDKKGDTIEINGIEVIDGIIVMNDINEWEWDNGEI